MSSIARRHKLLAGIFGMVVVAWGFDLLSGGQLPGSADAASSSVLVTQAVVVPAGPTDIETIIESLRDDGATQAALPFDQTTRDLFVPTSRMEAILTVAAQPAEGSKPPDELAGRVPPFEARHQLQAVLTGRVPLALIDGRRLRAGAEVDGYRLIELCQDYVVLRRDESRVTLRVAPAEDR
jgi:hypothetical protein